MRSYILEKVREMVLRDTLQLHLVAVQEIGSGEQGRIGVRDGRSEGTRAVRHEVLEKLAKWDCIFRIEV